MGQARLIGAAWLISLVITLNGCAKRAEPMTTAAVPTVTVIHPQRGDMAETIELPGDLVGFYETALHAKVTGYLQSISVDKGDMVRAGQVLAEIEVPELRSNLNQAKATMQIQRVTYDRLRTSAGKRRSPRIAGRCRYSMVKISGSSSIGRDSGHDA